MCLVESKQRGRTVKECRSDANRSLEGHSRCQCDLQQTKPLSLFLDNKNVASGFVERFSLSRTDQSGTERKVYSTCQCCINQHYDPTDVRTGLE